LEGAVDWFVGLAPCGVIEFVPKADPMVQELLANREDIFKNYTVEAFTTLLTDKARIVASEQIEDSARTLFWFDRT